MRRRFLHLALFLVLGAIINYALAMGIIWFGPLRQGQEERFIFHSAYFDRLESVGLTWIMWWPMEMPGVWLTPGKPPAWSRMHRHPRPFMNEKEWEALPDRRVHHDIAAGWPLRSVRYHYDVLWAHSAGNDLIIQSGIILPPQQVTDSWGTFYHPRAIPLRIIPAGFALNTLLFASLAAMIWYAPGTIRRIRRTRGNRCLKCGYPRAGLADQAACPECGTSSAAATKAV